MHPRFAWFALLVACLMSAGSARAADRISVAVGGKGITAYLPLTLAEDLGYFKEAGLAVEVSDLAGGAKMAEALVGGSADIGVGSYEHVLHLRPKGLDVICITLFNHTYGAVVGLPPQRAATYRAPRDLKGLRIGVIAPGSSMDVALQLLLAKDGLSRDDVSVLGIGAGPSAIAAMKSGRLDGIVHADPIISRLVQDGDIVPVVDTRTEAGLTYLYNGFFAGSAVLTTESYAKAHPDLVQAFTTQIIRAFRYTKTAPMDELMSHVPPEYYGADKAIYAQRLAKDRASPGVLTTDGRVTLDAARTTLRDLATFDPVLKGKESAFDLPASFDNRFVEQANAALGPDR